MRASWLAGLLDSISRWWGSLSLGQQVAIGLGIAFLVAVIPGMSLTLAFGISGVMTWGLDKSAGIATFVRDPRQATRSYLADATPGQVLADTVGFVQTPLPGQHRPANVSEPAAMKAPPRYPSGRVCRLPWTPATRQRSRESITFEQDMQKR